MLLAIDIGNTNIVVGVFEGTTLCHEFRLKSDPHTTVDEFAATLFSLFHMKLGQAYTFDGAIMSSVVPPLTGILGEVVRERLGLEYLVVGPGIKTGVSIKVDDPRSVGADRIVNAVAVKTFYGSPAIVIDFGTATTFDYLDENGAYGGGIIAPGIALSIEALVKNTAQLPNIELTWPRQVVGKGTIQAMQSGAVIGYVAMVDGLIDRIVQEKGAVKHIVATGGLGSLIVEHSDAVRIYDPYLNLNGLRLLFELNR